MRADPTNISVVRFGVFELDLKNHELRRNGVLISLQPQGFRILSLLACRPGQLVTRQEFCSELWPGEQIADLDSRLNFEIKKIREALHDDADNPRYIETVRTRGYRFIASVHDPTLDGPSDGSSAGPAAAVTLGQSLPLGQRGPDQRQDRMLVLRVFLLGAAVGALAVSVFWALSSRARRSPAMVADHSPVEPVITAVSPILPKQAQEITIEGHGFGHYTPFKKLDTPFLAIGDETAHWSAGRITPENPDDVTLTVDTWTDTDIIVSGFAGEFGKKWWRLSPGDKLVVRVWNPQTGAGPAEYRLNVTMSADLSLRRGS